MRRLTALLVWGLICGLVVETVDRLLGDPFAPLDVLTFALQVMVAIALWPLFKRAWGTRAEQT